MSILKSTFLVIPRFLNCIKIQRNQKQLPKFFMWKIVLRDGQNAILSLF